MALSPVSAKLPSISQIHISAVERMRIAVLLSVISSFALASPRRQRQAQQNENFFKQPLFIADEQERNALQSTSENVNQLISSRSRSLQKISLPVPFPQVNSVFQASNIQIPVQVDELITTTTEHTPLNIAEETKDHVAIPKPLPAYYNTSPIDRSVDLDGDGLLSLPEVQYAAFVHHGLSGSVVEGMFNQVDKNKDNSLDSEEFNEIRSLVLEKAENAALRYMQSVDTDRNKLLSIGEAQSYILKEHGIGHRDVERVWKLVVPDVNTEMNAAQFSKLRRRIRGMTIRLARQIMKIADLNADGHISLEEAQAIAFEQEGIGAGDVTQMVASVDDNNDGELNAPEFADFERIVRARAVETSRKALKVVDADRSNTLTLDEAKRIAFEHYGFDENVLRPFFDQADENENGHLDAVEFTGFRSVIRNKAVRSALDQLKKFDTNSDGLVSLSEAEEKTKREDDMDAHETSVLFNIADQNKSGKLDKVELADFIRLVRLSAIRFATDHFKEFDTNLDNVVTVDELSTLIENKYHVPFEITKEFFEKVDVDKSDDLIPAEIVDFRHEIRQYVAEHDNEKLSNNSEKELEEFPKTVEETESLEVTTTTHLVNNQKGTQLKNFELPLIKLTPQITREPIAPKSSSTKQVASTKAQSTPFPTLLSSIHGKLMFRKHTTPLPKANYSEILEESPTVSSTEIQHINDMSNTVFNTEIQNIDDAEKTTSRIPKIWKSPKRTTTQRILLPLNVTLETATDKSTNKTSVEPAKNKSTSLVSNTVSIVGEEIAANETTGHKKQSTTDKITVTTVPTKLASIKATTIKTTTSEDIKYDILTEVDNKGKDLVDEKQETRKQQTKLSTDKQKYDVPVTAEVEYMEDKTPNSEYEEVVEYVDDDTTNAPSQQ